MNGTRFGNTPEAVERDKLAEKLRKEYLKKYGLRPSSTSRELSPQIPGESKCVQRFRDHVSRFTAHGVGHPVAEVWQPYISLYREHAPFTQEEYIRAAEEELRVYALDQGLTVRVSAAESWHYPGETFLIEFRCGDFSEACARFLERNGFTREDTENNHVLSRGDVCAHIAKTELSGDVSTPKRQYSLACGYKNLLKMCEKAVSLYETDRREEQWKKSLKK